MQKSKTKVLQRSSKRKGGWDMEACNNYKLRIMIVWVTLLSVSKLENLAGLDLSVVCSPSQLHRKAELKCQVKLAAVCCLPVLVT